MRDRFPVPVLPLFLAVLALTTSASGQESARYEGPIIDVHMHAYAADAMGPPPLAICAPFERWPTWDQRQPYGAQWGAMAKNPTCANPVWSAESDEALLQQTLEVMERHDIVGVVSGPREVVSAWVEAAPERFIPGLAFTVSEESGFSSAASVGTEPDTIRRLVESGAVEVLGEVINQYAGVAPDDERMAPYWALAEELDVPVGIHIGPGPPGVRYLSSPGYRARLHSPLALEEVLVKHPKLRVYVMHAGYPMIDEMLTMLYAHPQLHVDIAVLAFTQPRAEFHRFLRRIVEAGFGKRVMWGSDQMVWPGVIEPSIEAIQEADYLTRQQKADILYHNAARFLRLSEEELARHLP